MAHCVVKGTLFNRSADYAVVQGRITVYVGPRLGTIMGPCSPLPSRPLLQQGSSGITPGKVNCNAHRGVLEFLAELNVQKSLHN